jgi:hypothetical protein
MHDMLGVGLGKTRPSSSRNFMEGHTSVRDAMAATWPP